MAGTIKMFCIRMNILPIGIILYCSWHANGCHAKPLYREFKHDVYGKRQKVNFLPSAFIRLYAYLKTFAFTMNKILFPFFVLS